MTGQAPNYISVSSTEKREELHIQIWIAHEPLAWILMDGEEVDGLIAILKKKRAELIKNRRG